MIVKEKSNSMKRLKYLIAMPLAVVSMLLFTCNVSAGTYKETSSVVSNDTLPACSADSLRTVLHFGEIPVKESYAESDTVQIVRLDSEKLRLPEGFGWASAQTYQNGNVLIRTKATYENDKGDVLRLSSSVPWTAERLQSFIEEAKKGMLKSLNENYGEKQNKANKAASNASDSFVTSSATTTSRIVIETNDVEDFFDMYGKKEGGIGYNNNLFCWMARKLLTSSSCNWQRRILWKRISFYPKVQVWKRNSVRKLRMEFGCSFLKRIRTIGMNLKNNWHRSKNQRNRKYQ